VRNALVDAQFEHLRVDHQHPQVFRRRLVQQAQYHRVHRHRLARAGGTGDQQVGHARQIGHGRAAGDILAERQGQHAGRLVVLLGAQQLGQIDHFAGDIGDFQPHHRLARNHIDHTHRLHRQAARDVLVQRADLADLDARRGLDLEARDHRARIGADHLGLDAEVLELELDLARQGFQRFLVIALGLRLGIVQQRQRGHVRPIAVDAAEHRDLGFAFGAVALLQHRLGTRLDLDRLTLGAHLGIDLAHFLALLAQRTGLLPFAGLLFFAVEQRRQRQHGPADLLHHREPRQAGGQGDRGQQQHQHEQVRAQFAEPNGQRGADQLAENAAGAGHIHLVVQPQVHETGAGDQETDQTDQAQRRVQVVLALAFALEPEHGDPRQRAQHHRQHERDVTEQLQQHIGHPGAHPAAHVVHRRDHAAGMRPAGIGGRIGKQTGHQIQQRRRHGDHAKIPPQPLPARIVRARGLARRRLVVGRLGSFRDLFRHLRPDLGNALLVLDNKRLTALSIGADPGSAP